MFSKVALWLLIAMVLYTVFMQFGETAKLANAPMHMAYSDFVQQVRSGSVKQVSIPDNLSGGDILAVMNDGEIVIYDTTDKVFSKDAELQDMGLDVPEITKVAKALDGIGAGIGDDIYTVKYAAERIIEKYGLGK